MENIPNEEVISRNNWGASPKYDESHLLRMQALSTSNVIPESSYISETNKRHRKQLDVENEAPNFDTSLKQIHPSSKRTVDNGKIPVDNNENLRRSFYNCDPNNMTLNDEIYFLIHCLKKAKNRGDTSNDTP